jgi:zinc protease
MALTGGVEAAPTASDARIRPLHARPHRRTPAQQPDLELSMPLSLRRCLAVVGVVVAHLFVPASAQSAATPAGVHRVTSVEGITEYRLDNGLRVLLYPDESKPTTTVNITYLVGSRHENYGETGMAHLLEHLIFKGSKNYPDPDKEFSRRGFRNNGSTGFDRTNYFSTFQASDDNLRWALGWKADAMVNSFIARKDLDSEMTVVRNEYEMGESQPGQVLFKRMFAVMFDWHNYGNLPIGNRSDIENVRIENLQAFYRRYYQPDNAVLAVAGRFEPAATLRVIAQTFGKIARPKRTLPQQWTVEPTADGERSVTVRRQGDIQLVIAGYRIPAALSRDIDAISAAAAILGNTPNGRLHRELVEKGLAAQVFAFPMYLRDPGVVMFGAVVKKGEALTPVRERLVELVEGSLAAQPPTDEEMTRYRREAETGFERALADPQQFGIALSEYIALGDWRLFFVARDRAATVSAERVAQAASTYFLLSNRTVGAFVPDEAPRRAEIALPLTAAELLKDFKPRETVAAGEAFDPSHENIDRRTRIVEAGELKLALLPKKTRGETVNVAMNFRFGDERSLAGRAVVEEMTRSMLGRGTQRMTRQQIADERTRLKMTGGWLQFEATRTTLAEALRLVAHVLREANFPADEFELLKRETLTALQAQLNDPGARSRDAMMAHFNTYPAGDPRRYIPLVERIELVKAVARDDVARLHAEFWGTARGEIAIVGDFDDRAIERVVREGFADWASQAPYARILSEPRPVPPARLVVATPDKENAFFRARLVLDLRDDDADAPALVLANDILGGGSGMSNRLMQRLRQRDGLSYGAGSGLQVGGHDRAAAFSIGAIAAPQNMDKVEAAVREELQNMLKDGFTAKEVEDARRGLLQARAINRSDNGVLAAAWVGNLDLGRTFAFSRQVEDRLRALTADDVNAAVRRHIDLARLTVVVAGDPARGVR